MRQIDSQQFNKALECLGVLDDFAIMNQCATSFNQLQVAFEEFKKHVKKCYLAKAKKLHPDKAQGDIEKMKTLNAAYDTFKKLRLHRPMPPQGIVVRVVSNIYGQTVVIHNSTTNSYWPGTGIGGF